MVYLAELLLVMTDGLKIVRIHAQYVHKCLDDDAFLASLSLSLQSDGVACWCAEVPSYWNIKKLSLDNLHISASGLWARKLSRQYALFTLTPNLSNLIVTNPVLGKKFRTSTFNKVV